MTYQPTRLNIKKNQRRPHLLSNSLPTTPRKRTDKLIDKYAACNPAHSLPSVPSPSTTTTADESTSSTSLDCHSTTFMRTVPYVQYQHQQIETYEFASLSDSDLVEDHDFDIHFFQSSTPEPHSLPFINPDPCNPAYIERLDSVHDRACSRITDLEESAKQRAGKIIDLEEQEEKQKTSSSSLTPPSLSDNESIKQQKRKNNNTKSMKKTRLWRKMFVHELEENTEKRCNHFRQLRGAVDRKYEYLRQVYSKLRKECKAICETLRPADFQTLPDSIRNMCISFNIGPYLPDVNDEYSSTVSSSSNAVVSPVQTAPPLHHPVNHPYPFNHPRMNSNRATHESLSHTQMDVDMSNNEAADIVHFPSPPPLVLVPIPPVVTQGAAETQLQQISRCFDASNLQVQQQQQQQYAEKVLISSSSTASPSALTPPTLDLPIATGSPAVVQRYTTFWNDSPPTPALDVEPVIALKDPLAENPFSSYVVSTSPVSESGMAANCDVMDTETIHSLTHCLTSHCTY